MGALTLCADQTGEVVPESKCVVINKACMCDRSLLLAYSASWAKFGPLFIGEEVADPEGLKFSAKRCIHINKTTIRPVCVTEVCSRSTVHHKPTFGLFLLLFCYLLPFTTVLFQLDFSHGKFGLPSPGKVSCDRIVLLNLGCMLGVLVFR